MEKENIRQYGIELGADVVGFAAIEDYKSKKTVDPKTILPGVKSAIVLGYRENHGSLESDNTRIAMMSRMGNMELALKNNYLMARHIEKSSKTRAASVSFSYPIDMESKYMGGVGDFSLRHAAVAAGLGVFGRHNLVIHPDYGTRIIFTAILSELPFESDKPVKDTLCDDCDICVENCPGNALDDEGKTDFLKCLTHSQPYGIGAAIGYFHKFIGATPDEQRALLRDQKFLSLYQASFIGFQYSCFKCFAMCPACI